LRRHAKASSAGSTPGQAGRSTAHSRLLVLICLATALVVALTASSASAAVTHPYMGLSFGPDGTAATSFANLQGVAVDQSSEEVFVYDAGEGKIYKFDAAGNPVDFSALTGNAIEGIGGAIEPGTEEIAVAPASAPGGTAGDIYVANNSVVKIYGPSGAQLGELTGGETCGVATDPAGHVFVGVFPSQVREYTPSANSPFAADQTGASTAELPNICNVAADGLGNVYAANFSGANFGAVKLEGLGAAAATPLDPAANTLAVNPANDDVYANRRSSVVQYDSAGNRLGSFGVGRLSNSRGVAVNGASEEIYANNGGTQQVDVFGPGEPPKATIEPGTEATASVTATEATLQAQVNPQGNATTYRIEYGTDTAYGQSTPESSIGSDEAVHNISKSLQGLTPGTTYHWRLVLSNSIGMVEGPDHVFRTHVPLIPETSCPNQAFRTGASAKLPDCRAYELVSPLDKGNLDIVPPISIFDGLAALDQSASSGEKLTYTTSQSFGDSGGAPYVAQYIASRGASGWSNQGITPPQGVSPLEGGARLELDFFAFTADLCVAGLRHTTDPVLVPGAVDGFMNLYRRRNCGEEGYEPVTTIAPFDEPPNQYSPAPQGLSANGKCTIFEAELPGTEPFKGTYESCGSEGQTHLISVLPNGAVNQGPSSLGTRNDPSKNFPIRRNTYARAVSADGTRVYWTAGEAPETELFVRLNASSDPTASGECEPSEPAGACTVPVSSSSPAHFWSASPDGSKALFSEGELNEPDGAVLYEFDLASKTSMVIAPRVSGVVGASEDASRITFVSKAQLISGVNAEGKAPVAGRPNLYLFDSTKSGSDRYRFIGGLSDVDAESNSFLFPSPFSSQAVLQTSRVNPDGSQIAFMSTASFTGYDNTDLHSGQADAEIFAYDAAADGGQGRLRCVSCNPSAQRPAGADLELPGAYKTPTGLWAAAVLPFRESTLYGSRVISDDGNRIFFQSYDALALNDTNGKVDIYQWEAPGTGGCSAQAPAYSNVNEGCLSLISSGESPSDARFLDASPDGRDVFFTTASSLLPQDPGLIDIYDARAGGGYPPPLSQPAVCEGEACQSPPAAPNDPTPASSAFNGPGNLKSGHKHQKKKHHKKKAKQKKRQHRANDNRRSAR
jgi:hypothetical protein